MSHFRHKTRKENVAPAENVVSLPLQSIKKTKDTVGYFSRCSIVSLSRSLLVVSLSLSLESFL